MGRSSPLASAAERNVALTSLRAGRPKLILEMPRAVFTPSSRLTRNTACKISETA